MQRTRQRGQRNLHQPGDFLQAAPLGAQHPGKLAVHRPAPAAPALPARPRRADAGRDALAQERTLQFRHRAQDGEHHMPERAGRIHALGQAQEMNAERVKLFQRQ